MAGAIANAVDTLFGRGGGAVAKAKVKAKPKAKAKKPAKKKPKVITSVGQIGKRKAPKGYKKPRSAGRPGAKTFVGPLSKAERRKAKQYKATRKG